MEFGYCFTAIPRVKLNKFQKTQHKLTMIALLTTIAFIIVGEVTAFYERSDVVELTANDFKQVLKGDEVWVVEFYAPWLY